MQLPSVSANAPKEIDAPPNSVGRPACREYARGRDSGRDLCGRKGLRSKSDLDVKEILNLWAGKLRGSEVNAGQVLE